MVVTNFRSQAIYLVTGGSRSGKSHFAEQLCVDLAQKHRLPLHYVATCPHIAGDTDLAARIDAHKVARANFGWTTHETPIALQEQLNALEGPCIVLIECLGLWVSNLLYRDESTSESHVIEILDTLCRNWNKGVLVFVGQEAGSGILPMEKLSRRWLDLLGKAKTTVAAHSHQTWLVVAGLGLALKNKTQDNEALTPE